MFSEAYLKTNKSLKNLQILDYQKMKKIAYFYLTHTPKFYHTRSVDIL